MMIDAVRRYLALLSEPLADDADRVALLATALDSLALADHDTQESFQPAADDPPDL